MSKRKEFTPGEGVECDVCGEEYANKAGVAQHQRTVHGIATSAAKERAPRGGGGGSRKQKLQSSLAMIGLGLALLDPVDGGIWADDVPTMAEALDAGAKQYQTLARLCDMIEDAGPVALIVQAFFRPLARIAAHHGVIPARVGQAFGPVPAPSRPPERVAGEPVQNGGFDGGGMNFGGFELTPDLLNQAQRMAEQFFGPAMTGASTVTVTENGQPDLSGTPAA